MAGEPVAADLEQGALGLFGGKHFSAVYDELVLVLYQELFLPSCNL